MPEMPPIENEFGIAYVLRGLVNDVRKLQDDAGKTDRKLDQMLDKFDSLHASMTTAHDEINDRIDDVSAKKMDRIPNWLIGVISAAPPVITGIIALLHKIW